jgi:hydroxymethylglutaryl-CoA lyase
LLKIVSLFAGGHSVEMTTDADQPKRSKTWPERVSLMEVGPRDGFQFEKTIIPMATKIRIIEDLAASGIAAIQVASFVRPEIVPQMADVDEMIGRLNRPAGVRFSGLALNEKGIQRAYAAGLDQVEVVVSASRAHSLKNSGLNLYQAKMAAEKMVDLAHGWGMRVRFTIACAFGCAYEGAVPAQRVLDLAGAFLEKAVSTLSLADTTGMAHPRAVKAMLVQMAPVAGKTPVALHLHDTRGLGLVNVMTALECGVRHFDCAFGGLGGCPFVTNAAGNIATEDTAYLLHTLGIQTGVDIAAVARVTEQVETFLGRRLPARVRQNLLGR